MQIRLHFLGLLLCIMWAAFGAEIVITPNLPTPDEKELTTFTIPTEIPDNLSGRLQWGGPMAMANLMTLWAEALRKSFTHIEHEIDPGRDQEIWPPTLAQLIKTHGVGSLMLGATRPLLMEEAIAAEKEIPGLRILQIPVALDAIKVIVHADNPVTALTLPQLDAIFSQNRRRGNASPITTWADVTSDAMFSQEKIVVCGRNKLTSSAQFFRRFVLKGGEFTANLMEHPGSTAQIKYISEHRNAIGYVGFGLLEIMQAAETKHGDNKTKLSVRAVPLIPAEEIPAIAPQRDTLLNGTYPLKRLFYLQIPMMADAKLSPQQQAALAMILSKEGQGIVALDGYVPLPNSWIQAGKELVFSP